MSAYSPRYSPSRNRTPTDSRSDAKVRAALEAVRHVASLDPDGARFDNGLGFSKSDVALGHRLSKLLPETVCRSPGLAREVLRLAARYRR